MSSASQKSNQRPKSAVIDLIAGGTAGLFEALCCHPLDTIKVRMQLYKKAAASGVKPPGLFGTGYNIFANEGFFALYKGLSAVCIGIVPKMAIRFSSYNFYRSLFTDDKGVISGPLTFVAGVMAGLTEACIVVNPMEVVKIRMQAQHNSLKDPLQNKPKYRNAPQAAVLIVKEEGLKTLWRGVALTAGRQAINQGANFTTYSFLKSRLQDYQNTEILPTYQTAAIGFISGAIGPFCNNPLDTIKTRMQKETAITTESNLSRGLRIGKNLIKESGISAFYKGIIPRVIRVASGQCVVFPVYELFKDVLYDVAGYNEPVKKLE